MKKLIIIGVASLLLTPSLFASSKKPVKERDKISYSIGVKIGTNMRHQGVDISLKYLLSGLTDSINKRKIKLSQKEMESTMINFRKIMIEKMQKKRSIQAKANLKIGKAFLKKNKKRKGVKSLKSGLQYKIIKKGKGKKPTDKSVVVTNYRGTLLDGTEFDSSYKRKRPATFPLQGVIPGWREALKLMPLGSKWKLFIPPSLAYGESGNGRIIGPNSTLIFEIELIKIKK